MASKYFERFIEMSLTTFLEGRRLSEDLRVPSWRVVLYHRGRPVAYDDGEFSFMFAKGDNVREHRHVIPRLSANSAVIGQRTLIPWSTYPGNLLSGRAVEDLRLGNSPFSRDYQTRRGRCMNHPQDEPQRGFVRTGGNLMMVVVLAAETSLSNTKDNRHRQ